MKRNIDMKEVSDGRFYGLRDMVKAGCDGCRGCSDCCRGMGDSILLDPYDIFRLTTGLNRSFDQLLNDKIELNIQDGMILPNLKMNAETESCGFLTAEGRCGIHPLRPGICRIFPLGRFYENGSFQYFLQIHECKKEPKTKVKLQKWIDTPEIRRNEQFIIDWHYFIKDMSEHLSKADDNYRKTVNLYILKNFFQKPYDGNRDFYQQFYERFREAQKI
ncbi:MAG: YkgJ family cysteine cluster protein [Ruminococcus sp.]|jgi:Fe-S-cluster containining protein